MRNKIIEILDELSEYPQFNVSCKKYLMDYNYEEAATRIVELKEEPTAEECIHLSTRSGGLGKPDICNDCGEEL